uniref:UBC core domain-containing protein n=1 Tax=Melopsittacus undulatus TaxID=13146 RepID=A0A8V5GNI0_MELUD
MEPRGSAWQTSNAENLPPHILRLLYRELSLLSTDPPDGIKLCPNEEDVTDVQVTIEGPEGTPYSGGLFRMKLVLGKEFPTAPPKGFFLTRIFHPNVGPGGEICVNVLRRDWRAELGLRHVLLVCTGMYWDGNGMGMGWGWGWGWDGDGMGMGEICVNVLRRDWRAELGLRHVLLVCTGMYWDGNGVGMGWEWDGDGNGMGMGWGWGRSVSMCCGGTGELNWDCAMSYWCVLGCTGMGMGWEWDGDGNGMGMGWGWGRSVSMCCGGTGELNWDCAMSYWCVLGCTGMYWDGNGMGMGMGWGWDGDGMGMGWEWDGDGMGMGWGWGRSVSMY